MPGFDPGTLAAMFNMPNPIQAGIGAAQQQMTLPMMAAQLAHQQLGNQQLGIQNQYLGPSLAAQLQNQQIQNQYLPSMDQSQINLQGAQAKQAGAQAGYLNTESQFYPQMLQIQLAMARARGLTGYAALARSAEGQALLANNPGALQQFKGMMLGGLLQNSATPQTQQAVQQAQSQTGIPQYQSTFATDSIPYAPVQMTADQQSILQNMQQGGYQPSDIAAMQQSAQSNWVGQNYTGPQQQQMIRSLSADNMMNRIVPQMADVFRYAGLAGQSNMKLGEFMAQFGQNSPQYTNYYKTTRVDIPNAATEIMNGFGHVTDTEKKDFNTVTNPLEWDNNPQLAAQRWNELILSHMDNSKAIIKPLGQIPSALQEHINNPPLVQIPASNNGSSAQPIQMPSFQSKAQFQSWYTSLSPAQKSAVRAQLGG